MDDTLEPAHFFEVSMNPFVCASLTFCIAVVSLCLSVLALTTPKPISFAVEYAVEVEFVQCAKKHGYSSLPVFWKIGSKFYTECTLMGRRI